MGGGCAVNATTTRIVGVAGGAAVILAVAGLVGGVQWLGAAAGLVIAAALAGTRYAVNHQILAAPLHRSERLARRDLTGLGSYVVRLEAVRRASTQAEYLAKLRPDLVRLAAALLAEHHDVDLTARPAEARALLGEDVWPLLDPRRADERPDAVRVDDQMLMTLVERLEGLASRRPADRSAVRP